MVVVLLVPVTILAEVFLPGYKLELEAIIKQQLNGKLMFTHLSLIKFIKDLIVADLKLKLIREMFNLFFQMEYVYIYTVYT